MTLENGLEKCNCPKLNCSRHGKCEECVQYHGRKKRPPYCKREKRALLGRVLK